MGTNAETTKRGKWNCRRQINPRIKFKQKSRKQANPNSKNGEFKWFIPNEWTDRQELEVLVGENGTILGFAGSVRCGQEWSASWSRTESRVEEERSKDAESDQDACVGQTVRHHHEM